MRRTLLKLLRISEFSDEAQFRNPSLLFTVQDVICLCCNFCRSIDLCHDPQLFKCSASRSDDDDRGEEYEKDADAFSAWHCPRATRCTTRPHSELRLVEMIQAQSVAYQLQDCTAVSAICQLSAKCAITAHVQRRIHLYLVRESLMETLRLVMRIAQQDKFAWLLETVERLMCETAQLVLMY
ncbi:unnamed protein product [Peronospora belbahrii]|uniref:DNA polymerase epsilon catalytic subunit n=1 Tax=Peronospora belbahrii TaxID=622444 RepID=A0AAU9KTI7_9STRA|nr:unnamed protein product [Peronospora belbahrii]